MALTILILLAAAAVIYLACEFFVNGVEWIGHRFDVGQKATGTILAAFGTALPESVVTFVAVAFGNTPAQKQIGVGAALGGPLVLATIAYAVAGWTLLAAKRPLKTATAAEDFRGLSKDQGWFLLIFMFKLAVGLVAFAFKPWLGVAFLAAYAAYVWQETRGEQGEAKKITTRAIPVCSTAMPVGGWAALGANLSGSSSPSASPCSPRVSCHT